MKSNFKIKDLPKNERPQEKLFRYGATSLSNSELLAIILRSGTKDENILYMCNRMLNVMKGLNGLLNASKNELTSISGIKDAKAAQILALGELSKRLNSFYSGDEYKIGCPRDVFNLVSTEMTGLKQEILKLIMVNTKNVVLSMKDISIGSLNSSIVHPREVFKEAVRESSASIIICHNHPSGDPTPSEEDISITCRLKECSKILGIELLDHVIIGYGKYVSFKEKGLM